MYIKRMRINGFKKFNEYTIEFNEKTNIIIGDNESGKSSIIEAINIVLNQQYKNYDKYIIKELLNSDNINKFTKSKNILDLPKIEIEMELVLDDIPSNSSYFGEHHNWDNEIRYGLIFKCEMDESMIDQLLPFIEQGKIPFEYYQMTWSTYQGENYNINKKPLKTITIDTESMDVNSSFNNYNKFLFNNNHSTIEQLDIKNDFRNNMTELFENLNFNELDGDKSFGFNNKKAILENIITIFDNDIPIHNKGKGRENIIKTTIALEKKATTTDVIAIEEPECHLSFLNLKKLINLLENQKEKQVIITTHESMITSNLGLLNTIFLGIEKPISFNKTILEDDSMFFQKATSNNLIQFILCEKVILVEGPTEYMLVPKIYEKEYGKKLEDDNIGIIDCHGITYERYIKLAKHMGKKVLVLTDNDGKDTSISKITEEDKLKIAMHSDKTSSTWEICFYDLNKDKFAKLIKVEKDAKYECSNMSLDIVLRKMLSTKTDTAYSMLTAEDFNFVIPDYIKESLEWIRK